MANDRTLTLLYNTLDSYEYDETKIESDGANCILKLINKSGQEFQEDFSSSVGFGYESDKAEFADDVLKALDQTPLYSVLGANFLSDMNLDWNKGGSTSGTLNGVPTLVDGYINCVDAAGVRYSVPNKGAFELVWMYKPDYTSPPDGIINIVSGRELSGVNNMFMLIHASSGDSIRLTVRDSAGANVWFTQAMGLAAGLVEGTEYEMKLIIDNVVGYATLYIDGLLYGTLTHAPWNVIESQGYLELGASPLVYNLAKASFSKPLLFDRPITTAPYEIGYSIPAKIYLSSLFTIPEFSYSDIGDIQEWESLAATITGSIKFIHNDLWHNGTSWVSSNGTEAQSNSLSEVQSNIGTLPTSNDMVVKGLFTNSNTQQIATLYRLFYTGQKRSITKPWIMINTGTYLDGVGELTIDSTTPIGTSIKVATNINNSDYWWNPITEVIELTDGTPDQTNTIEEFNDHMPSFSYGLGKVFKLKVYLITTDENETPSLFSLVMTYNFAVAPNYPLVCKMYGFITNMAGEPVEGAEISFSADDFYSGGNLITKGVETVSVENGYYEQDLIRTVMLGIQITQEVKYTEDNGQPASYEDKFYVPNEDAASISDHLAT
jgi:hypothetical protein